MANKRIAQPTPRNGSGNFANMGTKGSSVKLAVETRPHSLNTAVKNPMIPTFLRPPSSPGRTELEDRESDRRRGWQSGNEPKKAFVLFRGKEVFHYSDGKLIPSDLEADLRAPVLAANNIPANPIHSQLRARLCKMQSGELLAANFASSRAERLRSECPWRRGDRVSLIGAQRDTRTRKFDRKTARFLTAESAASRPRRPTKRAMKRSPTSARVTRGYGKLRQRSREYRGRRSLERV